MTRPWTRAEMLRDAAEVEADYREYVADQYRQAAWEASEDDMGFLYSACGERLTADDLRDEGL